MQGKHILLFFLLNMLVNLTILHVSIVMIQTES